MSRLFVSLPVVHAPSPIRHPARRMAWSSPTVKAGLGVYTPQNCGCVSASTALPSSVVVKLRRVSDKNEMKPACKRCRCSSLPAQISGGRSRLQ